MNPDTNHVNESSTGNISEAARSPLIHLLIGWRQKNELGQLLRRLSVNTLIAWHTTLVNSEFQRIESSPISARRISEEHLDLRAISSLNHVPTPSEIIQQIARYLPADLGDAISVLRYRIAAIVEVTLQTGLDPGRSEVRDALDQYIPIDELSAISASTFELPVQDADTTTPKHMSIKTSIRGFSNEPDAARSFEPIQDSIYKKSTQATNNAHPPRSPFPQHAIRGQEFHISSVLPFLILRPLADVGYLETLDAALIAVGIGDLATAFGAALAYKVLDPPERGWRRSPAVQRTVSAVSGFAEDVPNSLVKELAHHSDKFVSALNAVLAQAVLSGHNSNQPLYLSQLESPKNPRFFLAETQGLFPILIEAEQDEIVETLNACDSTLLLIQNTAASPQLLSDLHSRGHRFLIDVPPSRGENWRAIKNANGQRWWTNDAMTSPLKLTRQAAKLADTTKAATAYLDAVGVQRPAIPNENDQQLDHSLTLAAGVALAQIAWDLWREREPTDPMLTLERFADLDANVQFTETEVRVRLPLGRRSMDLYEHGLLQDVVGVPWLGERIVKFSKG